MGDITSTAGLTVHEPDDGVVPLCGPGASGGMSWNSIIETASGSGRKLSRATLSKLARRVREAA